MGIRCNDTKPLILAIFMIVSLCLFGGQQNGREKVPQIVGAVQINPTTVEIRFDNKQSMTLDFYGDHIFRMFMDPKGGIIRKPSADPQAEILVQNPRTPIASLRLVDDKSEIAIQTEKIEFRIEKKTGLFRIYDSANDSLVVESIDPFQFSDASTSFALKESPSEYFYGGGVQNGRFSHKGKSISIENQNSWTDGGVASPTPYYWSTNGYGMMWYTFAKGTYSFGSKKPGEVTISHDSPYLDVFWMINTSGPAYLLKDFYQLTGNPVLLPKFGFYQGHLNAYNRDYWTVDNKGILFEDGKRYKESQKENGGTKESLNGEKNNYQFSARAVVDRYADHDMPLGWILPNDGYGAGYGQTSTLDSNILNLKSFGDYSRDRGVEIGLWTQSDLHPKEDVSALLQRDIVKEVRDAGVRVLKTDVAWVGPGYSFGLNGVSDVGEIIPYYGNDARPFIISLDGWAGTQRYAGIWSGDQTGGVWEYIRFHIPTYIGSGLSGQPNISSDMDGIFGGKNVAVNIRDFQWKTFSPMQLNMDGWGSNPKYPHILGDTAETINRAYLKLKSELLPYTYSIAKVALTGLPMLRAMFLQYPNAYTLGKATQYQYLYGSDFIIAPIYQNTAANDDGDDIRNGIYLPAGVWFDYFSGEQFAGDKVINGYQVPIWKLPIFVKAGAIIPMQNPNNNPSEIDHSTRIFEIYPYGESSFDAYDDDGISESYKANVSTLTKILSKERNGKVQIDVLPTEGNFAGFDSVKSTILKINTFVAPKNVSAKIGRKKVRLSQVESQKAFEDQEDVFLFNKDVSINRFGDDKGKTRFPMSRNTQLWIKIGKTDVKSNTLSVNVDGIMLVKPIAEPTLSSALTAPDAKVDGAQKTAFTISPTWKKVSGAIYYEIEHDSMLYSTITDTIFTFSDLNAETKYDFKIRSVHGDQVSEWKYFEATTDADPLQFAVPHIVATSTAVDQSGYEIGKLVNFDEKDMWHTKWGTKAVPFDIVLDLRSFVNLDRFDYLPRENSGNGILMRGKVFFSENKKDWTSAGELEWAKNTDTKSFQFRDQPRARYIKISVEQALGDFGSGRELYVFKVPGTESYMPGDINNDKVIDENDLTSYMNYIGLRTGDGDFEGYISRGDVNGNGLIDAFDLSHVTTLIHAEDKSSATESINGTMRLEPNKTNLKAGDELLITLKGTDLVGVNAFSFALPYDEKKLTYLGMEVKAVGDMQNFTNDRLHSNKSKSLYPTFSNVGNKKALDGTIELFILKFKVNEDFQYNLHIKDGIMVDRGLNTYDF